MAESPSLARGRNAILFDLDDTLFAYKPCNEAGLAAVARAFGPSLGLSPDRFRARHDAVRTRLAERMPGVPASHNRLLFFKEIAEDVLGEPHGGLAGAMSAVYWDAFLASLTPDPGAVTALAGLRERFALGVVSNQVAAAQLPKVTALGIERLVDAVTVSEEAGADKPDGAVFALALARLGVEADAAVMVGDDPKGDIGGGRRAGLAAIHVTALRGLAPAAEADAAVERARELPRLLLG